MLLHPDDPGPLFPPVEPAGPIPSDGPVRSRASAAAPQAPRDVLALRLHPRGLAGRPGAGTSGRDPLAATLVALRRPGRSLRISRPGDLGVARAATPRAPIPRLAAHGLPDPPRRLGLGRTPGTAPAQDIGLDQYP